MAPKMAKPIIGGRIIAARRKAPLTQSRMPQEPRAETGGRRLDIAELVRLIAHRAVPPDPVFQGEGNTTPGGVAWNFCAICRPGLVPNSAYMTFDVSVVSTLLILEGFLP
jgi:hypothetical protein